MSNNTIPILEFIENFKRDFNNNIVEDIFLNGNCYHFAVILNNIYPNGEIYYDQIVGHFVFRLGGNFYDINGEYTKYQYRGLLPLYYIKITDNLLYDRLVRDCMLRLET